MLSMYLMSSVSRIILIFEKGSGGDGEQCLSGK